MLVVVGVLPVSVPSNEQHDVQKLKTLAVIKESSKGGSAGECKGCAKPEQRCIIAPAKVAPSFRSAYSAGVFFPIPQPLLRRLPFDGKTLSLTPFELLQFS